MSASRWPTEVNCATTNAAFFKRIARTAHSPLSIARSRTQRSPLLSSLARRPSTRRNPSKMWCSQRSTAPSCSRRATHVLSAISTKPERINFKGDHDVFTLDLNPDLQPASSFRATENLAQQPRNSSPLYRAIFAAPVAPTPSSIAEPAAKEIPILSAPHQLELLLAQPGATCDSPPPIKTSPRAKPAAPFLSDAAAARVKFLHTCFGGALTANNLADFMLTYP